MIEGHCLCGDVRYAADAPVLWQGYCHCESCRRSTASPVAAFLGVAAKDCRFPGSAPVAYASSPGVRRYFCGRCGTPIAYESEAFPGELHFYAATLNDPSGYAPTFHVHAGERLPWFDTADELPRFRLGTSGEKLDRG
ncbi:MAG: GFA family protein [Alphaproteobacteria bacterium]